MENRDSQNLLIDADDTLWENNIYFERVIREVQTLLDQAGADTSNFRSALDDTERRRIPLTGYGTVNFTQSLVETVIQLMPPGADPGLPDQVKRLALSILDHPIEVIDGVPDTLAYLSERHTLLLVTKGNPEEQSRKINASTLRGYFRGVEILSEKNTQAYTSLLVRHGWDGSACWMIGNSPRSDINPALAAGMKAVYIPHVHTWTLEHEEPIQHSSLLELACFSDLKLHF